MMANPDAKDVSSSRRCPTVRFQFVCRFEAEVNFGTTSKFGICQWGSGSAFLLGRSGYFRSKAITSRPFPKIHRLSLSLPEHNLCLNCAPKDPNPNKEGNLCKMEA